MLQLEKVDIVLGVIGHLYDRKNVLPHDAACLPEAKVACCYCPAVPIKRQELTAQTTQKIPNGNFPQSVPRVTAVGGLNAGNGLWEPPPKVQTINGIASGQHRGDIVDHHVGQLTFSVWDPVPMQSAWDAALAPSKLSCDWVVSKPWIISSQCTPIPLQHGIVLAAKETPAKLVRVVSVQAMQEILKQEDWPLTPDNCGRMPGCVQEGHWDVQWLWQIAFFEPQLLLQVSPSMVTMTPTRPNASQHFHFWVHGHPHGLCIARLPDSNLIGHCARHPTKHHRFHHVLELGTSLKEGNRRSMLLLLLLLLLLLRCCCCCCCCHWWCCYCS
jgi:hypothetical protein